MAVLQISSRSSTTAWTRLEQFLAGRRSAVRPVEDLEAFEVELHEMFAAAEAEALGQELAYFDIDSPVVEIDGIAHRRVLRCESVYLTSSGPVRVLRSLYSTRQADERAMCPMELRAGIVEGYWTPLAAKQGAWAVAHLTPHEAEELFSTVGGMQPSRSSLDRLPKQLSKRWEQNRRTFEAVLRSTESVPRTAVSVAVSLDGVKIPVKEGEAKPGTYWWGPGKFQEVACATLSLYDKEGERLRTIRMARMPENYKKTAKSQLANELQSVLRSRPDLQIVKVADAALEPWKFLKHELPPGICIVDFYHAAEHLHTALQVAHGEGTPKCREEFERLRHILRHDRRGVERVIRSLIYLRSRHPKSKRLRTELAFFRKNRGRMAYAKTAAKNLPIGSGVVEAACKTLATQRLRRSGMRWRHDGGQAILTLRSLAQSDRFDRGWALLAETYRQHVTLPTKIAVLQRLGTHPRVSV
jgi:hypothetical protein